MAFEKTAHAISNPVGVVAAHQSGYRVVCQVRIEECTVLSTEG
jgi:hypothetical protein